MIWILFWQFQDEQRKLLLHSMGLADFAKHYNFEVIDTFNITVPRYKDFLQGKCACHFHRVSELKLKHLKRQKLSLIYTIWRIAKILLKQYAVIFKGCTYDYTEWGFAENSKPRSIHSICRHTQHLSIFNFNVLSLCYHFTSLYIWKFNILSKKKNFDISIKSGFSAFFFC